MPFLSFSIAVDISELLPMRRGGSRTTFSPRRPGREPAGAVRRTIDEVLFVDDLAEAEGIPDVLCPA